MKKLWPFTLLVAAFFVSCGEEVIQTVYVPDSDTVYLGQEEEQAFIIFRNIWVVCGYVTKED